MRPEGHNFQRMFYTTNKMPQFAGIDAIGTPIVKPQNFSNTDIINFYQSSLPLICNRRSKYVYALIGSKENIDKIRNITQFFTPYNITMEEYQDPTALYAKIKSENIPSYCFGLQVDEFDTVNDKYSIQIRYLKSALPDTLKSPYDPLINTPSFTAWQQYVSVGFLNTFSLISDFIIKNKSPIPLKNQSSIDVAYVPMKTPEYEVIDPQAVSTLSDRFPFFLMFTFLLPLYYIVSKLSEEKESKSREGMKMMGLKDSSYYLSWFVFHAILSSIMSVIVTLMLLINLFPESNKLLIFLMTFFYSLSLFGFSIVIVSVFPNARSAATAATLSHLVSYFAVYAINDPQISASIKLIFSIFPNIGMSFCVFNLFQLEFNSTGLSFSNMASWYNNATFLNCLGMLIFDFAFYLCLGLYLDQILQSQFGVPKKWYFICTKNFWCTPKPQRRNRKSTYEAQLINDSEEDEEIVSSQNSNFESIPESLRKQEQTNECLQISGLRKEFGKKIAVSNSSITMYNGQIFALLGHNGAGKTTTISMLTGLLQATKGSASVKNISIFEEMDEFRKILGVCPQHDVLFESLTPREHLRLFASFKGSNSSEIDSVVDKMIKDIDLQEVENQLAKTLSGGQKRKLSVGIAMIGNSKVVILDEPSSGMDTSSRRRLWEMLKQNKQGKIIILTTHYMDEADILGDRICIMADGKIKCCGSSLFLKNRYGVGYNLVIAKNNRDPNPKIDKFVATRIRGVKKLSEVSSEMTFQLPTESSSQFKRFFNSLDRHHEKLGIRSYGVGITTLEEVFLNIASEDHDEKAQQRSSKKKQAKDSDLENYSISDDHEEGFFNVFFLNLRALIKKKLLLQIRDPRTLIIEVVFPIAFIFLGLGLASVKVIREGIPRPLDISNFPQQSLYYNERVPSQNILSQPIVENYLQDQFITQRVSVPTDISKPSSWMSMVSSFDDKVFEQRFIAPGGFYGNYFLHELNEANKSQIQYSAFAMINATSQDAVAFYGAYLHQGLLRKMISNPKLTLNLTYTPFPLSLLENGISSAAGGSQVSMMFAFAYMMVSDSLIQNIIRERVRRVKQQMTLSGMNLPAYWISHYLIDIIFQAPPSIAAMIGIQIFNIDLPQAWTLILIFVFVNPLFIYAFSCLFESTSSASLVTRLSYVFIGAILPIAFQFLLIFPQTVETAKVLRWFFYCLPIYSLNYGVSNIASREIMGIVFKKDLSDPLNIDVAGTSLIFLLGMIPIFWIILFLYESKVFRIRGCRSVKDIEMQLQKKSKLNQQTDSDVIDEEIRVDNCDSKSLTVMVSRAKKNYGSFPAVKGVSFGLEYGECFALLGVSGAGKTTVFKCLTGEEIPNNGKVFIQGHNVSTSSGFNQARSLIGYCPQFDAIFERLTVREHLEFYAAIKGVVSRLRTRLIQKQLEDMDLLEFESVYAENLSGGNKRKLSVAMAMIGNPPIVFLDEPSTGVDPKAKRFMWNIVSKISTQRKKSSVIITTHSMEEAEALCTKMGIMVAGKFKCFGSSQHIKSKYGTGYEIEIKIKTLDEGELHELKQLYKLSSLGDKIKQSQIGLVLNNLKANFLQEEISKNGSGSDYYKDLNGGQKQTNANEFIKWVFTEYSGATVIEMLERMFSSVEVIEHFSNTYKIKVSKDEYSIGYLFGMMEDIKEDYSISEYSVSQTSLEQIFNNFAKQSDEAAPKKVTLKTNNFQKSGSGQKSRIN
ncbi:hypothetical protein FGO68_gene5519 [Halteria grandinella]|uniref:ABC transporter domain-containing protein n=1 Tax=Halteria grandinella TaxID=5974 RepID=A0A8J8P7G0_HALGN|nr:hypothetical protein FGO68_gene5519 [Halteria grandinella]